MKSYRYISDLSIEGVNMTSKKYLHFVNRPKWAMIKWIFLLVLFVSFSCQSGDKRAEENYVNLPDGFMEFYDRFHSDSAFQMSRITFPLAGKPSSADFEFEVTDARWTREGWKLHRAFDENDDTFDRQFIYYSDDLITEFIYSPDYGYYMERRWANMSDGWNLIYFADMQDRKN